MKVLLFHTNSKNPVLGHLVQDIKGVLSEKDLECCHDFGELIGHLKDVMEAPRLRIFVAGNTVELDIFSSIHRDFRDQPLIVVLPEDKEEMVFKASRLFPRFIGYLDSSYQNITAVLEKMINNEKQKSN